MKRPTLYFEIGVPGSGKSTHAKEFCANNDVIHLSSDELRGLYGKDESDQSVSDVVFTHMRHTTDILLSQGRNVLIDATNRNRFSRRLFIAIAAKYNARTVAFIHKPSLEICLQRNAARYRKVPEEVIIKMYETLEVPCLNEMNKIIVIQD